MAHLSPDFQARIRDDPTFRYLVFSQLTPAEAAKLMNDCGRVLPRGAYIHCAKLTCQSPQHTTDLAVDLGPPQGWVQDVSDMGPAPTFVGASWKGTKKAAFYNAVTADNEHPLGWREPSLCVEPANVPAPGMHTADGPPGYVLVCSTCKAKRSRDWLRKFAELTFGVCTACERWAIANMAVGQNDCTCGPQGNNVGEANNNEPRHMHWCRMHEITYWAQIRATANPEINLRRMMLRTKLKKRGHGWTRKKGQGRATRTPAQRRLAHRQGLLLPTNRPACYCGERLAPARHQRFDANGAQAATDQVRNCVGCNQFVRKF